MAYVSIEVNVNGNYLFIQLGVLRNLVFVIKKRHSNWHNVLRVNSKTHIWAFQNFESERFEWGYVVYLVWC